MTHHIPITSGMLEMRPSELLLDEPSIGLQDTTTDLFINQTIPKTVSTCMLMVMIMND